MLLQTFVQLNILLMAAPALAGWVVSPVASPMLAQAAQVVFLSPVRRVEATPQAAQERHTRQPAAQRLTSARPLAICSRSFATGLSSAEPTIALFSPFPHAARAP